MTVQIKSTKKFLNLPCGHAQWFDKNPDGTPGHCASIHGYDRAVELTFSGDIDINGWIFPFGKELKPVKAFLEYYFDHVTILPADDPRLETLAQAAHPGGPLAELRVMPSGVSMEMSSLFIWEHVNAYIYHTSGGRVVVEKVQVFEHERNSGMLEVDIQSAKKQALNYSKTYPEHDFLPHIPRWDWEAPKDAMARVNR